MKWQEDSQLMTNSHILSQKEVELKATILSLMTKFQASVDLIHKSKINEMNEMQNDGLITIDDGILHVTQKGRIFLRNIAYLFDDNIMQEKKFSASI